MSLSQEERIYLIKNRISNAEEILFEAEVLLEKELLKGTSNRIYYALFNLVHGLALTDNFICKTHKSLQAYFNKEYIQSKIISKEVGKAYNTAVEMRTTGDYQIAPSLEFEEVKNLLAKSKVLKKEILQILHKKCNFEDEPSEYKLE